MYGRVAAWRICSRAIQQQRVTGQVWRCVAHLYALFIYFPVFNQVASSKPAKVAFAVYHGLGMYQYTNHAK